MIKSGFLTSAALALGLLLPTVTFAETIDISEGTMSVGGNVSFNIAQSPISNIPSQALMWNINIDAGYFIIDNLEVNLTLTSTGTFTDPIGGATLGVGAGAKYYFDTNSCFFPYLGTGVAFNWRDNPSQWFIRVPVYAGVLVSLNSHVALDVGTAVGFSWNLTQDQGTLFDLSAGYFGVRAFF